MRSDQRRAPAEFQVFNTYTVLISDPWSFMSEARSVDCYSYLLLLSQSVCLSPRLCLFPYLASVCVCLSLSASLSCSVFLLLSLTHSEHLTLISCS